MRFTNSRAICGWSHASALRQRIPPAAENQVRKGGHAEGMRGRIERRVQLANIAAVLVLEAPVGDHAGRDLQMKLEPINIGFNAKSLVAAEVR